MMWYFAYGSNMSENRMTKRKVSFSKRIAGKLADYALVFDKDAGSNVQEGVRVDNEGYANVIPSDGSVIEGVLYLTNEKGISRLDCYEGYPYHYDRNIVEVETPEGEIVEAVAYFALKTRQGLKPRKSYMAHLLEGNDLLSESYFNSLLAIETLD